MNPNSIILFARPSFVEGMARTLDFGGTLNEYNSSLSEEQADCLALNADWMAVGQDLLEVFAAAPEEFADEAPGSCDASLNVGAR